MPFSGRNLPSGQTWNGIPMAMAQLIPSANGGLMPQMPPPAPKPPAQVVLTKPPHANRSDVSGSAVPQVATSVPTTEPTSSEVTTETTGEDEGEAASTTNGPGKRKRAAKAPPPPPPPPPNFTHAAFVPIDFDRSCLKVDQLVAHWHEDKSAWFVGRICALNWKRNPKHKHFLDFVRYTEDGHNPDAGYSFNPKAEYIAATATDEGAYGTSWTFVVGQESQV